VLNGGGVSSEEHITWFDLLRSAIVAVFSIGSSLPCPALPHHNRPRLNDAYADEQRKHDAAINQLRAEAAAREAALQERSRQAAELTQQLEAAAAALGDEQRKAESLRQLQQTTSQQLEAMRHTHTVGVFYVVCTALLCLSSAAMDAVRCLRANWSAIARCKLYVVALPATAAIRVGMEVAAAQMRSSSCTALLAALRMLDAAPVLKLIGMFATSR
jgi:hypothetical protein